MIQLNYGHLRDEQFNRTVIRLFNFQGFDIKVAHRLMKIRSKIERHASEAQKAFLELVEKFATKDETGNLVPLVDSAGKPQLGTFQIPEDKKSEWETALNEFKNKSFEIDNEPVDLTKLEPARLSAVELEAVQALYKA